MLLRPELVSLYRALSLDQTPETRRLLRHFVELDVLFEDYAAAEDQRLGREMAGKRRIYLDQCWWNFMRDAQAGSPQHPKHPEILELLTSLVASGHAVCPVSFAIFEETIKQGDRARRRATASVIDQLSRGIALRTLDELVVREVRLVLRSVLNRSEPNAAYRDLGWTHVGELAGQYPKEMDDWTPVENNLQRKLIFDVTRSTTFSTTIESTIELMGRCKQDEQRFNSWIDDQCDAHRGEFSTFEGLLAIEVNGGIDACADLLVRALDLEMTAEKRAGLSSATEEDLRVCRNGVCHVIDHEVLKGGDVPRLPSLHVMSVLQATRRWAKQKAKLGDQDDRKHAALALGYCDLFLTEKCLAHTLTSGPGNLSSHYGCEVIANPVDVAERLRRECDSFKARADSHALRKRDSTSL